MKGWCGKTAVVFLLLASTVLLTGMGSKGGRAEKEVSLAHNDEALARQIEFEPEVLRIVRSTGARHLHRMTGYDQNGFQIMVKGLSASMPAQETDRVLAQVRRDLSPRGYMAFVIEVSEGIKNERIGILKGTDPYDILRVMQTNGDDYDISNQDVIDRLKEWEKHSPFEILGAEDDWVELEFKQLPANLDAFAREVAEFSPDTVGENDGSIREFVRELAATKRLFLWWDR